MSSGIGYSDVNEEFKISVDHYTKDKIDVMHCDGQEKLLNETYRQMAEYHYEKLHSQTIFLVRARDLQ